LFATRPDPKPLRPHQSNAIALTKRSLMRGNRAVVLQMATGAGKTRTAAEIISGALAKGNRVAFTVPAISLVDQTIAAFESEGIDAIGVMQANHARTNRAEPVQVVSVQTLARRERPEADVVIVDECHVQHKPVLDWMADTERRRVFIGLTATPWAKGMGDVWQDLVIPVRMQELIDQGYLSPFRVYAPSHPDLSGVKIVAGDYHEGQLAGVMGGAQLVADIVQTWKQRAQGLPTLVFAVNRAHAAQLVQQFADAGVTMGYCDANVDLIERQLLFAQMKRGEIAGIVNIGTLTTGVDADVRCIVLARPTKSEMLFVQMIGRGLRTAPGKDEALILDHADNHQRLGFVTDIHHDRLLTGKEKPHASKQDKGEPTPKPCGSCGALKPPKVHVCPKCGFKPERQSEVEVEPGELVEFRAKPPKHDRDAKQKFWSMANYVDRERGKGGRLAKALYKGKFGVWPQGLDASPIKPDGAFLSYEHSRRIAYAKGKGRRS
jgi:superfamily II DNA or RNA helicase